MTYSEWAVLYTDSVVSRDDGVFCRCNWCVGNSGGSISVVLDFSFKLFSFSRYNACNLGLTTSIFSVDSEGNWFALDWNSGFQTRTVSLDLRIVKG